VEPKHNSCCVDRNLSRGQRGRVALLSAIAEDRPVYIFDEWAANQDGRFKKLFYNNILPELKERRSMVVVITHDEDYDFVADRLLRFHGGRVLELNTRAHGQRNGALQTTENGSDSPRQPDRSVEQ